jgi:hypothetical protein
MLVAVSVTGVAALITVVGALNVTLVPEAPLSVAGPDVMLQLTPEFEASLTTESLKTCDPPAPRLALTGLIGFSLIAASVIVADTLRVESEMLVAVTTAVYVDAGIGLGELYATGTPLSELPALNEPPPLTVQVTPPFEPSLATVAVSDWLAPAPIVSSVAGPIVTEIGVNTMLTDAVLVGSDLLVAVTVACATLTGAGAVYTPPAVIVPVVAVHITPAFAASLFTDAVKFCVAPPIMLVDANVPIETPIRPGTAVETLPFPPHPASGARATKTADKAKL